MTAQILSFRKPVSATPVPKIYRAQDTIQIRGPLIRGFGLGKDAIGRSVYNATLTDILNNQAVDLGLVVLNPLDPANESVIVDLASGEAIAVEGYLEMVNGVSHFVVTAVTEMRRRDLAHEAMVQDYIATFENEALAAQSTAPASA